MARIYFAVVFIAFLCITSFAAPFDGTSSPATTADEENYRLPTDILPQNYKISLKPYLLDSDGAKQFTFDGDVQIEVKPTIATKQITLSAKYIKFVKSEIWSKSTPLLVTPLQISAVNEDTNKITYRLDKELVANQIYVLHITYNGSMDDDMRGFYRSSYMDAFNNTKWIGSTHFQTNHARRAFPCFDEPKFKATFDVSIRRHKSMKTFANTKVASTVVDGDYVTETFAQTPKMSTYLLAFIISEFKERLNADSTFGILARPEYYDQTEYSLNVGQKLLSQYDNYFGIKYYNMGIPKMHMAAIPDFLAGAMENWGLLTFRERSLLYLEGSTTLNAKQSIATAIAHEQSHMWFGDLVTCDWWSYTWLNEGFARYFTYFGAAMVEKEMSLAEQFVVDQLQSVMEMDATNSSNPMSGENIHSPRDLARMFNSITYSKGSSFIRMVKHAMGEENFQKSLQSYLKEYAYQNTVPANLFKHWKSNWPAATKKFTDGLFKSFTEQVGYPLVSVKVADDKKSFTISQKRFLLNSSDGANASLRYTIPITYTTDKNKNFTQTSPALFIEPSDTETKVSLDKVINGIILNIQETGYYRVNYDEANWRAISKALSADKWSDIHELNRAQIVDDLLNLARAGEIKYEFALEILEYLMTEINYLPWTAAFNGYSYLAIRLGEDTKHFSQYILELTEKSYKNLGFEERSTDSTLDIYNRAKVLSWSCKYGNEECLTKAREYFNKMSSEAVPVNIRSVVYCNALRFGNESDYDKLFNKYKTETVATEETLILSSLGCVKDPKLVEKYFNAILSNDVRRQDKWSALTSLYTENNENVTPVFELVTKDFEKLSDALGGYSPVATMIFNIASRFTEESQQKSLKEFNDKNKAKFGGSATILEAAEKKVEENLRWADANLGSFKSYLAKRIEDGAARNTFTVLSLIACTILVRLL